MEYIKISGDTYEEVPQIKPQRIAIKEINASIDVLQLQKDLLIPPTNAELLELGKQFHWYYIEKEKLTGEILYLRELKAKLQSL